jgi:hypothetical protein
MSELTVGNLFDKALDATSTGIKTPGFSNSEPWSKLIPKLQKAVGVTFEPTQHSALDDLRKAVKEAEKKKQEEGKFLAAGAAVADGAGATGMPSAPEVARSAALKMLRHTYYYARRGNHKMWIVSLPERFSQWPHNYLNCTTQQLVVRLGYESERFSATDQAHISDATQRGLGWVHKAQIVLDDLGTGLRGLRLLKRWFADEETTDEQLRNFAKTKLKEGLKKIATKMSAGSLIVTDFVPIRNSSDAADQRIAGANAFVWADTRDVVYVEKPFFTHSATSVFQKDERHWARIMVHEMSHREGKTEDNRYGWKGIKPKKGAFSSAAAMNNADSWALFVANAASAMSKTDISRALNGTTS